MRIIRCAAGIYRYLHQPPTRGHATSSRRADTTASKTIEAPSGAVGGALYHQLEACSACYGACLLSL